MRFRLRRSRLTNVEGSRYERNLNYEEKGKRIERLLEGTKSGVKGGMHSSRRGIQVWTLHHALSVEGPRRPGRGQTCHRPGPVSDVGPGRKGTRVLSKDQGRTVSKE